MKSNPLIRSRIFANLVFPTIISELERKREKALAERNYEQVTNYSNELGNLYYDEGDYDSALHEFRVLRLYWSWLL